MGVKNLVINRPAFHLSEKNYFRYILAISRILRIFGISYSLNSKELTSKAFPDQSIWEIEGTELSIKIQSQYRISRFLKGFSSAGKRQWDRYGITNLIGLHIPDVLIDVGANIGEVSYYANNLGVTRIIAVDPDPIAGECLEFNLRYTDVEIDFRALGEGNGEVTFYSQPHSADSSLFKPNGKSVAIKVQSLTLDDFLIEKAVTGDILLKMDAEGFEPEILRSGLKALEKINWVAIDAGAERGNETTVKEVFEILTLSGFEDINVASNSIVTAKRKV